jgi:hypothetical protein
VLQQVDDDLEVQVRRPPAVDGRVADTADFAAGRDWLPRMQPRNGVAIEVTIESEEGEPLPSTICRNTTVGP